jgi:hypothetical protein
VKTRIPADTSAVPTGLRRGTVTGLIPEVLISKIRVWVGGVSSRMGTRLNIVVNAGSRAIDDGSSDTKNHRNNGYYANGHYDTPKALNSHWLTTGQ